MLRYVITGAGRGIGRAIALKLARPDAKLYLLGRNMNALEETCRAAQDKGADACPVSADLGEAAGIDRAVAEIGPGTLHCLIHNAGVAFVAPFEQISLEQWHATLDVNVTAPFLLTQKLVPFMGEGSAIVSIISVAARTVFPQWGSYCMSKFALDGFSQVLREELRPRGIRVINIYPAATATTMWDNVPGVWSADQMLSPAEVAEAVAYALDRPASVLVDSISVGRLSGNL